MRTFIAILILLNLNGCSIAGRYYLRNLTHEPALVTILLNDSEDIRKWSDAHLNFSNKVIPIRFNTYTRLKSELNLKAVDSTRLEFIVPPKSTVFLGIGMNNGFWGGFSVVHIKSKEQDLDFLLTRGFNAELHMKGLFEYTASYDITK